MEHLAHFGAVWLALPRAVLVDELVVVQLENQVDGLSDLVHVSFLCLVRLLHHHRVLEIYGVWVNYL